MTPAQLSRRMRHLNRVLNQFWRRWKEEYLLELRDVHHCNERNSDTTPISVGDIVVVHDDKPRGFWKLARVEEVITGKDGRVRGAVVKVNSGKNSTVLRRPLQRLYPLEVSCHINDGGPDQMQDVQRVPDNVSASPCEEVTADSHSNKLTETAVTKRPTRASALEARDRVKALAIYDNES